MPDQHHHAAGVPGEPLAFQPRAELMAALDASESGMSVIYAAKGMRGVGTTQLAAAYARARLAAGWRLVAWVNAEDAAVLAGGLAVVAEALGLAGRGGDPGLAVRRRLEADGERCLVVFDNASDPDLLRPYLPAAGAARVLVTGSPNAAARRGELVEVGAFTPQEAAAFLADRTGLSDPAGAVELAEVLGFSPLGLALAAGLICGQRLDYGGYLERMRALPVADSPARLEWKGYPNGVAGAMMLSRQVLRGPHAMVMSLLCVLSAAGVRRDLLHAAGQAGVLVGAGGTGLGAAEVDEALGLLAEWSLLASTVDGQAVAAHRNVLQGLRTRLAKRGVLAGVCKAAGSALERYAAAPVGSLDRATLRDVPEQVAALQQAAAGLTGEASAVEAALLRLRLKALTCLTQLGDSATQAIAVGEPLVVDSVWRLGSDDRSTLGARAFLATAYQAAGRTAEAIPLLERTVADMGRVLGTDHPVSLAQRNSLANAYRQTGQAAEAVWLHEGTLAGRERVLGTDHPDTLGSRLNLATAYQAVGRTAEAIRLHERTLADTERVLGPDHQNTLALRNNLALAYQAAGRVVEARRLHEQTLADRERVLGPDHPDTLASRKNLAIVSLATGRLAGAPSRRHWNGLRRKPSP
jgi:tetratricopeptide (TPR) repeat protein